MFGNVNISEPTTAKSPIKVMGNYLSSAIIESALLKPWSSKCYIGTSPNFEKVLLQKDFSEVAADCLMINNCQILYIHCGIRETSEKCCAWRRNKHIFSLSLSAWGNFTLCCHSPLERTTSDWKPHNKRLGYLWILHSVQPSYC